MSHPHAHRFLLYDPEVTDGHSEVRLQGDEHAHLRVLRPRPGDTFFVTNGVGLLVRCSFEDSDGNTSRLAVDAIVEEGRENRQAVLALACLRKDAFEQAVKQCTELGVSSFLPVVTAKAHRDRYTANFFTRLRRVAVSAMKQSFRSVLPEIHPTIAFSTLIERAGGFDSVFVADMSGGSLAGAPSYEKLLMVVGPEAGLTDGELEALRTAGGMIGSVSRHRLRAETAASSLATLLLADRPGGDN